MRDPLRTARSLLLGLIVVDTFGVVATLLALSAQLREEGLRAGPLAASLFLTAFDVGLWGGLRYGLPRGRPDVLLLRSFRSDEAGVPLQWLADVAGGPHLRVAGILSPRRRFPSVLRVLFAPALLVAYLRSRHMALEAGPDWAARLWRSLGESRGAIVDLRDPTEAVDLESRLAYRSLGPGRVLFVVDEARSEAEWRSGIADGLGRLESGSHLQLVPLLEGDAESERRFVDRTRAFFRRLPSQGTGPSNAALAEVPEDALLAATQSPDSLERGLAIVLWLGALALAWKGGETAALLLLVLMPAAAWYAFSIRARAKEIRRMQDFARAYDPEVARALGRTRTALRLVATLIWLALLAMIGLIALVTLALATGPRH